MKGTAGEGRNRGERPVDSTRLSSAESYVKPPRNYERTMSTGPPSSRARKPSPHLAITYGALMQAQGSGLNGDTTETWV